MKTKTKTTTSPKIKHYAAMPLASNDKDLINKSRYEQVPPHWTTEELQNWRRAQAHAKRTKKVWAFINLGILAFVLRIAYELIAHFF